jgi:hypothetical protein
MVRLNPTKITSYLSDTASRVLKSASKSAEELTREMEMVPRYLEVAQLAKGEYRFNPEDIKTLTKAFGDFDTALCKSDVVKELLAIGLQKGEPLSIKEITAFLKATSSLEPKEQQNVLKFMKKMKEVDVVEYDHEYVVKNFTYENFRKKKFASYAEWHKKHMNWDDETLEKEFRKSYEGARLNELNLVKYEHYRNTHSVRPMELSQILTVPGYNFAKGIGKCDSPEVLAEIVKNLGPEKFQRIKFLEQTLVDAYKLSDGNLAFVNDLLRGFYPAESKAIVRVLKEDPKKAETLLKSYEAHTSETPTIFDGSLSSQRRKILKELGIDDKVKTLPLQEKEDVFGPPNLLGGKTRIISGNFEGGKRR